MNKKRSALALLLALAMMMGCVPAFAEEAAELTLMVYMTGSDLESLGGAATGDITEMLYSGVDTERVNIVFCAGGSKLWQNGFPNDAVSVYRMDRKRLRPLAKFGNVSMGAPETLAQFLNYTVENCPADRYALILWDHGGGPMNGVCFDELFTQKDGHDSLALSELRSALEASPFSAENPLEWIGFDACLMSSVETADTCAPYAKYMIASQETEPGSGWNYSFLGGLDASLGGDEAGARIVESYGQAGGAPGQMLTLACIDLSKVGDVESAMNALFSDLDGLLNPEHFSEISNARRDAKSFGRASTGSEYDLVDLYSLSEQYAGVEPEKVAAVQAAVDEAVVCASGNQENSHGLSVYYPYFNKEYFTGGWKDLYGTWDFARQYYGFLLDYAGVWLGEQMADWSNMRATAQDAGAVSQEITLPLTPEQVANFAFAQVFIIGKMSTTSGHYYKVDEIDDVALDDEGVLHADYNYKALYAVDESGEPLCDAIPYRIVDGYYLIRSNLTDKIWREYEDEWITDREFAFNKDASIEVRKVYLQCAPNEAGDGLDVVGIIDMGEGSDGMLAEGEGLYNGKQVLSVDMEGWNWVWFFHFPRELQRDGDGGLLSFEEWPNPNDDESFSVSFTEIDNRNPWSLKFLEQQYSGGDLYAQYIVHDTQGNLTGSNLIPVVNPTRAHVVTEPRVLYESEDFTLTLMGIDLAQARFSDGLYLTLKLEDRREDTADSSMSVRNMQLNHCMVESYADLVPMPDADGDAVYSVNIPSSALPEPLEEQLERIAFDFRVYDRENLEDIEVMPVETEVDINLSPVHTCVPMGDVLAEAQAGCMRYQLLGIREAEDVESGDCLKLSLKIENLSGEPIENAWHNNVTVDGFGWDSVQQNASFKIPAGGWILADVRLYTTSPLEGTYDNPDGTPQYSYPERWGTPVLHRLEFTDWENRLIRFDLSEPFAIPGLEAADGAQEPLAEGLALFEADDLTVTLTGFTARADALRMVLDIENLADVPMNLMAMGASLDGEEAGCDLYNMDGWICSVFSGAELPADSRTRYCCEIPLEDSNAWEKGIGSFGVRFQYRPEGETDWRFASEAQLGFAGGSLSVESTGATPPGLSDLVLLEASGIIGEESVDPLSLVDVRWDLPGDAADFAVTLRAPLDEAQRDAFDSAYVFLAAPYQAEDGEDVLRFVGRLGAPVVLTDGSLACDYNGLVVRMPGSELPVCQRILPGADGTDDYDLRAITIYTDNEDLYSYDVRFDELHIAVDAKAQRAWVDVAEPERSISRAETVQSAVYWMLLMDYTDGEGSELEFLDGFVGEEFPLSGGPVPLSVCPAEEFDLLVVFNVENRDGSAYSIVLPYAEACGQP